MAQYGSITIVDITDLGEFSVQPMSNLPLSVLYDPDQNTFTPSWASSTLQITPVVYYAGSRMTLGSSGLTITWQRQEGIYSPTAISSARGETIVNDGVLNVNQNQFTASGTMLTYIVTATYVEPASNVTLTSSGQITYSLVKNASTAKDIKITGDAVFKYNSSGSLVGQSTITLTATATGVSITAWQYQGSNGTWYTYPNSGTSTTLTVNETDTTFINDQKCLIRVTTDDADVYDLHTITKLRDGAAGAGTISAVLTNDDQMIPVDSGGTSDYSGATTRIIIYQGGTDVTSQWTVALSATTGVTYTSSQTTTQNDTVQVTGMTGDSGNITFTCSKSGQNNIIKTFSLTKVRAGADGVSPTVYSLDVSSLAMNRDNNSALTPSSVTFTAYQQTGTTKSLYTGRFRIVENYSMEEYDAASPKPNAAYTSSSNESSHVYTPSTSATSILCMLYASGGTSTRYDSQQVVVTSDGADGQQGPQGQTGPGGAAAVNVILGNYADVLTCNSNNRIKADQTVRIPFSAYEGTTMIPCTVTSVNLLEARPSIQPATASSAGYIEWVIPANTLVSNASGTLSISFTATASGNRTVTVTETYSWSRNTAAENTVLLQLNAPNGNIVSDTITSVTINASLLDGSQDQTSSVTSWQWAKFQNNQYVVVSGETTSSLTVQASGIDSYASYRCRATYNGVNYIAYYSVFDKTDPIQVTVLCSLGNQIKEKNDSPGAIYVKVTKNGTEIDPIYSERFLESDPTSAMTGDFYYKLNKTNRTVTLMKYNRGWQTATETYTGQYTWSWRDEDGNILPTDNPSYGGRIPQTTGKVIYIDNSFIDHKLVGDVEVSV